MQMKAKARARFSGGALHPLEPLDLAEGQEVLVSVEEVSPPDTDDVATPPESGPGKRKLTAEERREVTRSTAGAWKGWIDGEAMKQMLYEARRLGSREIPDS